MFIIDINYLLLAAYIIEKKMKY